MVNRSSYNVKSDIWSLGCLIYELCALVPPFLAANQKMLSSKIQEGHFKPIPSHYSGDLQRIIERMLTVVVGVFIDRIFHALHWTVASANWLHRRYHHSSSNNKSNHISNNKEILTSIFWGNMFVFTRENFLFEN